MNLCKCGGEGVLYAGVVKLGKNMAFVSLSLVHSNSRSLEASGIFDSCLEG